jgi:membrane protein DedA with SNARE-associated domain
MPFKIFVATAGTLEYPRWRFVLTVMIARSLRYYIEAVLAIFYGQQVIEFIKEYGFIILAVVVGVCLAGLIGYLLKKRFSRGAGERGALEEGTGELHEPVERATAAADATASGRTTD